MANRYWVGGTASWNTTSTTNWSATSGGAGGASVPTVADNVFFDQAGTYTVTMTGALACLDITVSAGTVTFATGTTPTLNVRGSMSLLAGTVWNSTGTVTFSSTSTGRTITTNGTTIRASVTFNGLGGGWTLQDAFTVPATATTTLTSGALSLNGKTLTTGFFSSSNSNTRSIAFGTGNITAIGAGGTLWTTSTVTFLTVSGTPVVNISYAGSSAVTIAPGALSETNSISFNFTTGSYALTWSGAYRDVNFTGFSGTVPPSSTRTIYGSLTFSSGMSYSSAGINAITFAATSGTKTLTTNGITVGQPIIFNGVGGTWQLGGALTMDAFAGLIGITVVNGTVTTNNYAVTAEFLSLGNTGSRSVTLGSSTVTLTGSGTPLNLYTSTVWNNTTVSAASSTISLTSASAKTAILADKTWGTINQGGSGNLTITGVGPTIGNLTNTVQPTSVLFAAGQTYNFESFSLSGTAGNLIAISSSTAAQHTLSKASGIVDVSYCNISYSNATGGATWNAFTSNGNVDGGNNTGWLFTGGAVQNSNFLMFFNGP